jgi:hypothetical protein
MYLFIIYMYVLDVLYIRVYYMNACIVHWISFNTLCMCPTALFAYQGRHFADSFRYRRWGSAGEPAELMQLWSLYCASIFRQEASPASGATREVGDMPTGAIQGNWNQLRFSSKNLWGAPLSLSARFKRGQLAVTTRQGNKPKYFPLLGSRISTADQLRVLNTNTPPPGCGGSACPGTAAFPFHVEASIFQEEWGAACRCIYSKFRHTILL